MIINVENGPLEIIKNCTETTTVVITESQYEITKNGIYLFKNNGLSFVRFYIDEETKCKLYSKLTPKCDLYYYYTALDLIQYCPNKYEEACEIYKELFKFIDNECDC